MRLSVLTYTLCLLFAVGCTGPKESGPSTPADDEATVVDDVDLAQYERFDADRYREPELAPPTVQHDVPARLMQGEAGAGQIVEQDGFRIQIVSSLDRRAAETVQSEFSRSWQVLTGSTPEDSLGGPLPEVLTGEEDDDPVESDSTWIRAFDAEPETYLLYRQPYYRVRVGNYADRAEAEVALRAIEEVYPEAFIVPDRVQVQL